MISMAKLNSEADDIISLAQCHPQHAHTQSSRAPPMSYRSDTPCNRAPTARYAAPPTEKNEALLAQAEASNNERVVQIPRSEFCLVRHEGKHAKRTEKRRVGHSVGCDKRAATPDQYLGPASYGVASSLRAVLHTRKRWPNHLTYYLTSYSSCCCCGRRANMEALL